MLADGGTILLDEISEIAPALQAKLLRAIQEQVATLADAIPLMATEPRAKLGAKLAEITPGDIDTFFFTNGGAEANENAIRMARLYTGRQKILSRYRSYHGATAGALTLTGEPRRWPAEPGIPGIVHFMDPYHGIQRGWDSVDVALTHLEEVIQLEGPQTIAAVIVEPVAGNMNCVPPKSGFLEGLRNLCEQYNTVLIFDEVMTGFRVAAAGAQTLYNVTPDWTTLGKVVGGGLPVGAFGGRAEIMAHLAPQGAVYQAGTLSGNPLAMAAGIATLQQVLEVGFYERLGKRLDRLIEGLRSVALDTDIPLATNHVGTMFGLFFTEADTVSSFADVMACDTVRFGRFFHGMLEEGIYLAPSAFEAGFISSAHGNSEIDRTLESARQVLKTPN